MFPDRKVLQGRMSYLDISITIVLASLMGGCAWDVWLLFAGKLADGGDYCDGLRAINKRTGGLFALCLLALWVHVFVLPLTGWWQ